MMNKIFRKVLNRIYLLLEEAHLQASENCIKNCDNVTLGNNTRIFADFNLPKSYGKIEIGDNTWIGCKINMFPHNKDVCLHIGKDCYIGDKSRIWCAKGIYIGDRVIIAHNVNIFDTTTHPIDKNIRYKHETVVKKHGLPRELYKTIVDEPIFINNDVWIACNSIIMKGVKIGEGSIVAAGSIIVDDVPPNVLVGGNPAKVLKKL